MRERIGFAREDLGNETPQSGAMSEETILRVFKNMFPHGDPMFLDLTLAELRGYSERTPTGTSTGSVRFSASIPA